MVDHSKYNIYISFLIYVTAYYDRKDTISLVSQHITTEFKCEGAIPSIMAGKKLTNMLACCFHDGENLIPGWSLQTQISFGTERLDLSVKTEDNSRVKMPLTGDWRETILIISKTYSEL